MKTTKYDKTDARCTLLAMALDKAVCGAVASHWPTKKDGNAFDQKGLFGVGWMDRLGGWCIDHFRASGEAIGEHLVQRFQMWAQDTPYTEEEIEATERFLHCLGEEDPLPTPVALTTAEQVFRKVQLKQIGEATRLASVNGKADEIWKLIESSKPIDLTAKAKVPYRTFSMSDMLEDDAIVEETFRVDNVMAAGHDLIIAGPQKTLKTLITLDLAVSLVSGRPFLGRFQVGLPGNVLVMSAESGQVTLRRNRRMIFESRCGRWAGGSLRVPNAHCLERFELSDQVPKIAEPRHLRQMKAFMEELDTRVLFIDTASKAMPGEQAANAIMNQEILLGMSEVCKSIGVQFVLLHHCHSLKNPFRPLGLDDLMYRGFAEHFGQWMFVSRRDEYIPPASPHDSRIHRLWLSVGGRAGHSGLYSLDVDEGSFEYPDWRCSFPSREEVQAARCESEDVKTLMAYVQSKTEPCTQTEIKRETGLSFGKVKTALAAAISGGLLVEEETRKGKSKQPCSGYRSTVVHSGSQ